MSQQQKTLWIGGYGPETSSHGQGLQALRDLIEAGSEGELSVHLTPNIMDEGRPSTDLLDLVESGEMFLCYFSSSYLGERVPAVNVLETPFLFESLGDAHRALDGRLGRALNRAVRESTGFELLGLWDNGFRHFTNRHRDVRTPRDCRGMRVRLQPNTIHEALMRSWGADPVPTELNDGIGRITRLEVDAQENPLANTVAYGVDRVHRHVTMTGHLYGARGLFAHRPTYRGLSTGMRALVDSAVVSAIHIQRRAAAAAEKRLRAEMELEGVRFVDLTPDERDMFIRSSAPAIELAHRSVPVELFELAGA